ncbi:MAG: integrase, partial [Pseudomonadales bacterium]
MALTQTKISRLTPTADCTPSKPNRYADVEGLYLFVRHTGNKVFYSRYRLNGKRVELKIGNYPTMTLQQARKRNLEIQQMAKSGTDPKQHKQKENDKPIFDDIANEWFTKVHKKKTVTGTYNRDYSQYTRDIKPLLGNLYLDEITAPQVLEIAIQIEKRGATDMSKRALGKVSEIYGYAKEKGY